MPRVGVLEVVITTGDKPTVTTSITRALSKLEAIRKAEARRPESASPLLVTVKVNGTTREFTVLADALRVVTGVSEILDAAKKVKIQLGELGWLDDASAPSQQSPPAAAPPAWTRQNLRPTNARDGDDGYGIGGGLGGQGGGGFGIANELDAALRSGTGAREAQIELLRQRLNQLLAIQHQSSAADGPAPKEHKLGEATLFSRMVHRDYEKATFSFEFGVRDDPTCRHANDWDLQYGNGGDHFHVTMVSDDRSRIVDLGKLDWGQLEATRLERLPPHPQPRREFVPTVSGHIYLVHTVDRNSDLYALFRVEAVARQPGTCDITWRLVDAPQ